MYEVFVRVVVTETLTCHREVISLGLNYLIYLQSISIYTNLLHY